MYRGQSTHQKRNETFKKVLFEIELENWFVWPKKSNIQQTKQTDVIEAKTWNNEESFANKKVADIAVNYGRRAYWDYFVPAD